MNRSIRNLIKVLGVACAASALLFLSFCLGEKEKDEALPQTMNAQFNKYDRSVNLAASDFKDQDDMCVWVHPTDASKSIIIASDKSAKKIFVYNLSGDVIQTLSVSKPGNIDTRYGFPLNGEKVDIVALNDRGEKVVYILKVDPESRTLTRIDDGNIKTGVNYGFTLYVSPISKKYYAFVSSYPGNDNKIWQFELTDNGSGKISGTLKRSFDIVDEQTVEGIVADDEIGNLYIAEEEVGIRKYNAEPDGGTEGELIRSIANDPLEEDIEGITIYYLPNGEGYIIACSQLGRQAYEAHYDIFERKPPHNYVTSFMLKDVGKTDGIDLCSSNLGGNFPNGIFLAHNASESNQIVVVDWGKIADGENLIIDTNYWNPRKPNDIKKN